MRDAFKEKLALLVLALQEAFTAAVPFFLLSSLVTVLRFVFGHFHVELRFEFLVLNKYQLWQLQDTLYRYSAFVATATIAYFLARRIHTSPVVATTLAIATLVSHLEMNDLHERIVLPYGFSPVALLNPVLSTYLLKALSPCLNLGLPETGGKGHMYRHLNYLFSFLGAYILTLGLLRLGLLLGDELDFALLGKLAEALPAEAYFALRDFLAGLLWFLGVHGDRVVNGLLGTEILHRHLYPNLSFAEFNRLFVVVGGAGVGLALFFALGLRMRDRSIRLLTLISAPFIVFNINTLLIYALVVLNRFLFLPFVFLPLFNIAAGLVFLRLVPVRFNDHFLMWNTPPFLDAYLKTGGDWRLVLFQAALVAFDTAVYAYFVLRYSRAISLEWQLKRLGQNLRLTEALKSKGGVRAFVAYARLLEAHAKLEALLQDLKEENLELHYQPIVPARKGDPPALEALLRYRKGGELRGPDFLGLIEDAGLASLIDIWVAKRAKRDLETLRGKGRQIRVSINLHPDTFLNDEAVEVVARTLAGEDVVFEIVERSFLAGEKAHANFRRLGEHGFKFSLDDFGSGYSSLDTLVRHPFDELKLDQTLVEALDGPRGRLVAGSIVGIAHELGIRVVAEGVEREDTYRAACALGVDGLQGYYIARPLPLEEALAFLDSGGPSCR